MAIPGLDYNSRPSSRGGRAAAAVSVMSSHQSSSLKNQIALDAEKGERSNST